MVAKKIAPQLAVASLFVAFLVLIPGVFTGCKSSPQAVAHATLSTVAQSADKALAAYYDAVVAGKVDEPTQAKVRDAKGRYQQAFNAAVAAARGNTWTTAPDDLAKLATGLSDIINAAIRK